MADSKPAADFLIENHGSLFLFYPQNPTAEEHIRSNVADDALWAGDALVVEPRYAVDLAAQLSQSGWIVR
jgi:hypothetical protein